RLARIFMRGDAAAETKSEAGDELQFYADTDSLLKAFLLWVELFDPDILIGWNVLQFDCRILELFCQRANFQFTLGRNRSVPHLREMEDSNRYQISLAGRVVLDGIDLLKTAMYSLERYSLESVSRQLLGEGKLIQGNHRADEIERLFHEDKQLLARYNL